MMSAHKTSRARKDAAAEGTKLLRLLTYYQALVTGYHYRSSDLFLVPKLATKGVKTEGKHYGLLSKRFEYEKRNPNSDTGTLSQVFGYYSGGLTFLI